MGDIPVTKKTASPYETRLEGVAEAMEDLTNAVVSARMLPDRPTRSMVDKAQREVVEARAALKDAMAEFTKPMLRVIEGGRQGYADGTADADKPLCGTCYKNTPCAALNCKHWAKAVRKKREEVVAS
jgi:hypothetical protein